MSDFRQWLSKQVGRKDAVGKFARKAMADESTAKFRTLVGYWIVWSDSDDMDDAIYAALREYKELND